MQGWSSCRPQARHRHLSGTRQLIFLAEQLLGHMHLPVRIVRGERRQPFDQARLAGVDLLAAADQADHRTPVGMSVHH